MPHFFIKKEELNNDFIKLIDKDNFFHLVKVLRIKKGEKVKFIDENQNVYESIIEEINKNELIAKIISSKKSIRTLKNNLVLVQSILANDAQNLAIANAVQTGVKKIYPVMSDNVSVSLSQVSNKLEKWQKIAYENFKQCERADFTEIKEITNLKNCVENFKKENILIFAERDENTTLDSSLKDIDKTSEVAIIIGPEGGFSQNEFDYFIEQNYKLVTLGNMIYKAPNAATVAISNVISRIE